MTVDVIRDRHLAEALGISLRMKDDHTLDPECEAALLAACRILLSDADAWIFFPSITQETVEPLKTAAMRVLHAGPTLPGIILHAKW